MRPQAPRVTLLPKRTVLTRTTVGDPKRVAPTAMQALYGTAYGTKFKVFKPRGRSMAIGSPSAFWPDAHRRARSKWTGHWMLEVPSFVRQRDLLQEDPKHPVKVRTLAATLAAEILHVGLYRTERAAIERLHAFTAEQRLKVTGDHEEVYLSRPGPRARTVIRYAIRAPRAGRRLRNSVTKT
jgi:hypothetical protein